jgi:23S rRNA (adenine2503-C2)-methyltransferase
MDTFKKFIKDYTQTELEDIFEKSGFHRYRARQVWRDVFHRRACDFDSMSSLPKKLRAYLNNNFQLNSLECLANKKSSDGTIKYLFSLFDNESIEAVLIPDAKNTEKSADVLKYTLCVSTQAGCALNCTFCATGKLGFKRNLTTSEIIEQYFLAEKLSGGKITNIVYMGMGEPLLNYENVIKSIRLLTDIKAIAQSKITVSTAGIAPAIIKLAAEGLKVKLAISLHATDNANRKKLIPIASKYGIKALLEAAEAYYRATRQPITYEYILFEDFNDTPEDIRRLIKISRRVSSKINLIKYHDIAFLPLTGMAAELRGASLVSIKGFISELEKAHVRVFQRTSSGFDIDAACGQLALSKRQSLF